ncbi:MAG: LexA family transcriptional regulator [Thermosipho sp. (in: Bacteria)]|nr:LexA family transcriptional regulator [Thermosipho sp. (in: thermotogales)]
MNIGEKIKNLRSERGLSQEELAKRVGVSRESISHYENGRVIPPIDVLEAIAKELGVSITYFFTNEETTEEYHVYSDDTSSVTLGFLGGDIQNFKTVKKVIKKPVSRKIPVYMFSIPPEHTSDDKNELELKKYLNLFIDIETKIHMALRLNYDVMEPYIPRGSLLLINKNIAFRNGDLILYRLNGKFGVRWYIQNNDERILAAENRKYKDIIIKPSDSFLVFGVVVGFLFDFKPHKKFL